MRCVVLDGFTLNPGDLSWDGLRALVATDVHERTVPADVAARAADAELLLTNKVVLNRAIISRLSQLKYIGVTATGFNVVEVAAAAERGIVVTNVPAYSTRSVAQLTFALLLELTHHVGLHATGVRAGRWSACADFSYCERSLLELDGLTLGIVGCGRIGRAVAEIAASLGMDILVCARQAASPIPARAQRVSLETLFRRSDVVSLHCPLTPETNQFINPERLAWLKPPALLLNTARGGLIDEAALADALNHDRLAGAGLDVLSTEPPAPDNPLLRAKNCLITPHLGWASRAARQRLMQETVENVRAFLAGQPRNVVS